MQLLSGVLVLVLVVFTVAQKPYYDVYQAPELFKKFMKDYNRHYKDPLDEESHYNAFVVSLIQINISNQASSSATYGINNFADYTPEEKLKTFGYQPSPFY